MRFADYAYSHIKESETDPMRYKSIDKRARVAGFNSSADFLDYVQGKDGTQSYKMSNNRFFWVSREQEICGWNNHALPQRSTVIALGSADEVQKVINRYKKAESTALGINLNQIKDLGPIPEKDRQVKERERGEDGKESGHDTRGRDDSKHTRTATGYGGRQRASYTRSDIGLDDDKDRSR